ncbi:MAG: hypothetical protein ABEJ64_03275 [Candidatus Nanohaloarchaea archaeon]
MAEDVVLVGGDGVDENFPAVLEPRRALEEEGYSVDVIELYEGFEQAVEEDGSVPEIESSIEDETRLVGYCAGGVLAYQYIDHPDVLSFTGYDVPSGLRVEDRELRVDEPVDREDVFLIYAGEIGGAARGQFRRVRGERYRSRIRRQGAGTGEGRAARS